MNMIEHVKGILAPIGIPVNWQLRPIKDPPSITYEFFGERGALWGDGKENMTLVSCQVDVWSKQDYTDTVNQVIKIMEDNMFIRVRADDDFEENTRIYHKVIVFDYYGKRG